MALTKLVGVDADSHNIQIGEEQHTHVTESKHRAAAPSPLHCQDHDVHMPYSYLQNIDIMDQVMLSP
jgi:hypothetical protein